MFRLIAVLLLIISIGSETPAKPPVSAEADKLRVMEKLEANIRESQKDIEELLIYIGKYGDDEPPAEDKQAKQRFDDTPIHSLDNAVRHRKYQRIILELIKNENPERIPALLERLYLPCSGNACRDEIPYWEAEDAFVAFGSSALQSMLDRFSSLDRSTKERVLRLLPRIEPTLCPTKVLDDVLAEHDFSIRTAAFDVYEKNCAAAAFHQKLYRLFAVETDAQFLYYLLQHMPEPVWNHPPTYNHLIQLVQQQRIPFDWAFANVCSPPPLSARLDADKLDIAFWLKAFENDKPDKQCLIRNLFLNIKQEKQLLQLRSLFHDAVEHHYHFQAVTDLIGTPSQNRSYWWDIYLHADKDFFSLFQQHLSTATLQQWRQAPDTPLGAKLLLSQWLGEAPLNLLPKKLRLQLEVRSPAGILVSSAAMNVTRGQPFDFEAPPLVSDFPKMGYSGTVQFNADKLNYTIKNFLLRFSAEPAAELDVEIPLAGYFETNFFLQHQHEYRWTISLRSSEPG